MNINDAINILRAAEAKLNKNVGDVLVTEWHKTIKLNFAEQGRPAKWRPKKRNDGRAILTGRTARLQRTINVGFDVNSQKISVGSNLVYSKIHQEGGVIHMRRRKVHFRVKKAGWIRTTSDDSRASRSKVNKNGETVYYRKRRARTIRVSSSDSRASKVSMQRSYQINIPARPYMVWTKADTQRALPNVIKAAESSFKI